MLKKFQKKLSKKIFLMKKNKKNQKNSYKKIKTSKKIRKKFKKIPPKKNLKNSPSKKVSKKCFQKRFTYLLIMATPKSLFERETRINIDLTSIPIASSLLALTIVFGLGY